MEVVSEGYGEGSIGVAGQADKASSYRVHIPLLSVGATKFRNLTTHTDKHPYTLLGVKLLQYGKVTIDYKLARMLFYVLQPDNEINNQCNNFDLTVKDGDLYVSTVWSSTKGKIEVGDKVIKINGKPTKKYDFCESILNGIPELKEKAIICTIIPQNRYQLNMCTLNWGLTQMNTLFMILSKQLV